MAEPCDSLFQQKAQLDAQLVQFSTQIANIQSQIDAAFLVVQAAEQAHPGPAASESVADINTRIGQLNGFIGQYNAILMQIGNKAQIVAQQAQVQAQDTQVGNQLVAAGCYQQ